MGLVAVTCLGATKSEASPRFRGGPFIFIGNAELSSLGSIRCLMSPPSKQQVLAALSTIRDPDLGRDVVSLGMIKELEVTPQGEVSFTFELTTPACPVRDRFKSQAEDIVNDIPGVTGIEVRMTANVRPAFMRP